MKSPHYVPILCIILFYCVPPCPAKFNAASRFYHGSGWHARTIFIVHKYWAYLIYGTERNDGFYSSFIKTVTETHAPNMKPVTTNGVLDHWFNFWNPAIAEYRDISLNFDDFAPSPLFDYWENGKMPAMPYLSEKWYGTRRPTVPGMSPL